MLAVGQTLGYAVLIYSFGALLVQIEAETGWARTELALGPTLSLSVAALSIPLAGKLVDQGWGGELLIGGPLLGGVGLILLSTVTTLTGWYLCWALIGLAGTCSLYDTCFAFLTRRLGGGARAAITRVTLVAGLASTLAFPSAAYLAQHFGWRGTMAVFGATELALTLPLNLLATRRLRRGERPETRPLASSPGALSRALQRREFWLVALAFGFAYLNHIMLVTYYIPLFTGLGATHAMAIAAASLVGPFQVIGRVALMLHGERMRVLTSSRTAFAAMALSSACLWAAGLTTSLIFIFAILQGAAIGVTSILRPVLIAEVLGRDGFGAISGAIAVAPLVASAIAPFAGALALSAGGLHGLIAASLTSALIAMLLALMLRR